MVVVPTHVFFRETSEYARYLNQLDFLKTQLQFSNTETIDDFEIYNDLLRDSVSQTWNVNQFVSERNNFRMAFFVQQEGKILHSGVETLIAGHVMDQLYTSSRIEFIVPSGISSLSYEPIKTESNAESFARARAGNADYYLIFTVDERDGSIECRASLHLGRTGRQLQDFRVIRSGNTRIKDAVLQLSKGLLQMLPIRGTIVNRNFESALINLGRNDGLTEGSELLIIKPADLSLHTEAPDFDFDREDLVGIATISKSDVLISQVEVQPEGFFDQINIGDTVFIMAENNRDSMSPDSSSQRDSVTELYERIRTIR